MRLYLNSDDIYTYTTHKWSKRKIQSVWDKNPIGTYWVGTYWVPANKVYRGYLYDEPDLLVERLW